MLLPANTLKVIANPYAHVDAHGRPAGAVLCDPDEHVTYADTPLHPDPAQRYRPRVFVAATRKATRLGSRPPRTVVFRRKDGTTLRHTFLAPHDRTWEFSRDAVEVPNTVYYQRMIAESSLFAADKASWVAAGNSPALWVEPADRLAWAKEGAVHHLLACHHPQLITDYRAACEAHGVALQAHAAAVAAHTEALQLHAQAAAAHEAGNGEHPGEPPVPPGPAPVAPSYGAAPQDYRLVNLALHWADHVEQRHPVAAAVAASADPAQLQAEADAATRSEATRISRADNPRAA